MHAGRCIVRNLLFDIKEEHLKKLFTPFGVIKEINIPQAAPKDKRNGKGVQVSGNRGFGFIEFATRQEAIEAIKKLNGTTWKGRALGVELSQPKELY